MIHIRRAELGDAAQIQRVYASTNTYSSTLQLPYPSIEMWEERLKNRNPEDVLLVAIYDGTLVGTAGLHPEKNARRRHVAGIGMGVADSFAGRGVGTALLSELLNLSDNWMNYLRLELTVYSDNAPAIHLYNKFGFDIEGTHKAYAMRNGAYVDAHCMARLHPRQPRVPVTGL
jgi:putative acetyltransferase